MHFVSIAPALAELGWTPQFHQRFLVLVSDEPELAASAPARIVADYGTQYGVSSGAELRRALLSPKLARTLAGDRPCIGDFVLTGPDAGADRLRIERVLERTSVFRRKVAGATSGAQAIAANVDLALILASLSDDDAGRGVTRRGLNVRRVERYLRAVVEAPAQALVVVTKADLRSDAAEQTHALSRELGGVEVVLTSAHVGTGVDRVASRLGAGVTAVLVGSSGAGKSSLTNRLLGRDVQRVEAVRGHDARGRHTTTRRELFRLPSGGLLIDTPGMRELALFADDDTTSARSGFDDIDALAEHCRFRDCRHHDEPGCAVLAAVERGQIGRARLEHSRKLRRELERQQQRFDLAQRRLEKQKARALSRNVRQSLRDKGRLDG